VQQVRRAYNPQRADNLPRERQVQALLVRRAQAQEILPAN
jgi:hypothetical protein